MNLLVDHLPDAIQVRGIEVPINTDFRASILYNLAVDRQTEPEDVLRAAVLHYVPAVSYTHLDVYKRQDQTDRTGQGGMHHCGPDHTD